MSSPKDVTADVKHAEYGRRKILSMPIELFESIINDVPNGVHVNITGGEPLLHPKINEILALLSKQNKSYTLLSNEILADKLVEIVRSEGVKKLELSCDGPKVTYKHVRGVDNYDNIVRIVDELRDEVDIGINFTMNPLNTKKDLIKVKRFCDSRGVYLAVGVYDNPEYFDTTIKKEELYDADGLASYPVNRYIRLYNSWLGGNLRLPCYSIRFSCFILPQGCTDVPRQEDRTGQFKQASVEQDLEILEKIWIFREI